MEWAIHQGIENATYHILTPYPSTALYKRIVAEGRLTSTNWELFDTRHTVFQPKLLTPESLEAGYWHAYHEFYRWKNIVRSSQTHDGFANQLRHVAYAGGWKKFEPIWDWTIRAKRVPNLLPVLETVLAGFNTSLANKKPAELPQTASRITSH